LESTLEPPPPLEATRTEAFPIILLPGLGGESKLTRRSKDWSESFVVSYLDWNWRRFMEPGCYFTSLILDIRRQIEEKVPSGPFYLAGYSIGGPLAFVCAYDCWAAGRPVAGLAILDAPAIVDPVPTPWRIRMRRHWQDLLAFDPRGLLGSVVAKILVRGAMLGQLQRLARSPYARLPFDLGPEVNKKLVMQLMRQRYWAWWNGRIREIGRSTVPTLLFSSADLDHLGQPDLGWGRYCVDLEVVRLGCSHEKILDRRYMGTVHAEILRKMKAEA